MPEPVLAAAPIALVLALMLGARWSAVRAGAVGFGLALVLALTVFDIAGRNGGLATGLGGALAEAAWTTATILWIIIPALAIHRLQVATGAVETLRTTLAGLSSDPRVSALLVAWFFALLIEGAAGFGTAGALAAPFLVAIGMSPLGAVVAALVGHAVGVAFGAVGTPVVPQAAASGLEPLALAGANAIYGAIIGWVFVLALAMLLARVGRHEPRTGPAGSEGSAGPPWGWALVAGAAFLAPFLLIATVVGPELPTLGGAVAGGGAFIALLVVQQRRRGRPMTLDAGAGVRAAAPYLVLVAVVLVTRLVVPLRDALRSVDIRWELADGTFAGGIMLLYHPGSMLFLALLAGALVQHASPRQVRRSLLATVRRIAPVTGALLVMLGLSRVMVHSGMIDTLALAAADGLGQAWPAVAPAVGALGTFVTGSATASNVLFSDLQVATAEATGLAALPIIGAQGFGAAIGNAMAPHNVIAAAAVVGLAGREAEILRRTFPLVAGCLVLAGILALVLTAR